MPETGKSLEKLSRSPVARGGGNGEANCHLIYSYFRAKENMFNIT